MDLNIKLTEWMRHLQAGFMMTMSMLKQASSKPWLSSKLWLLEFEIVVRRKGCEKFELTLHGHIGDHGHRF